MILHVMIKVNVSSKGVERFLRPLHTLSYIVSIHSFFANGFSTFLLGSLIMGLTIGLALELPAEAVPRHATIVGETVSCAAFS